MLDFGLEAVTDVTLLNGLPHPQFSATRGNLDPNSNLHSLSRSCSHFPDRAITLCGAGMLCESTSATISSAPNQIANAAIDPVGLWLVHVDIHPASLNERRRLRPLRLCVFLPPLCNSHNQRKNRAQPSKETQHGKSEPDQLNLPHPSVVICSQSIRDVLPTMPFPANLGWSVISSQVLLGSLPLQSASEPQLGSSRVRRACQPTSCKAWSDRGSQPQSIPMPCFLARPP
jgi:hypothetical protein